MPIFFLWFLMILPFAMWGTAMTAMAPLIESGGSWLVASLRLIPAGMALLLFVIFTGRSLAIDKRDLGWFVLFTFTTHKWIHGQEHESSVARTTYVSNHIVLDGKWCQKLRNFRSLIEL